jgi:hypothetical protein
MMRNNRSGLTVAATKRGAIGNESTETTGRGRMITAGMTAVFMVGFALIASAGFAGAAAHGGGAGSGFAVLANASATCTDGVITGDVGAGNAITRTRCTITGNVHLGDTVGGAAFDSFLTMYGTLANLSCDQNLTGTLDAVTLTPGVYCFDAAAALTGTLTLNGSSTAMWIFKIGTSGTGALTGTNFNVVMSGGGLSCNVAWWVSQAATLTDSNFVGSIYAGAAITVTRGTVAGSLYSQADITITGASLVGCSGGTGKVKCGDNDGRKGDGKDGKKGDGRGEGRGDDKGDRQCGDNGQGCNQGVGNGPEGCDPGHSNHGDDRNSNDEHGGTPGNPGRQGGKDK